MSPLYSEIHTLRLSTGMLPGESARKLTEAAISHTRLKVLLIDDHQLVREGLKLLLAQIDPGALILEAEALLDGIELCKKHEDIDLVLLDLSMPGSYSGNTLDVFASACPAVRVVVVSATCDAHTVQASLRKGALGFIPKQTDSRSLVQAIRFVLDGGTYVPLEALATGQSIRPEPQMPNGYVLRSDGPALTQRQMDVLRELLEGKSNKQICRDLNMAMGTVKSHLASIFGALRVSSRTEAIAAAERMGWRNRLMKVM